jgi:hypothetical protein
VRLFYRTHKLLLKLEIAVQRLKARLKIGASGMPEQAAEKSIQAPQRLKPALIQAFNAALKRCAT